jgi:hypothetical protein
MAIDKSELQEYFNTDEGKSTFGELFKSYAKAEGWQSPEEVAGLVNKKNELLNNLTRLKKEKNNDPLLTNLEKYGIHSVEDLETMLSATSTNSKKGEDTERMMERLKRELETERKSKVEIEQALTAQKQRFFNAEKQSAIYKALGANGFDESTHDVLSIYFDKIAQVDEDETGKLSIIADDGNERLGLSDYISKWSKTEKAKHYIKAPSNIGSGTVGGNGTTRPSGKLSFEQIGQIADPTARKQAMRENGFL